MTKVVAFSNQKGGTGKTTTVINTAGVLADEGYKVLVIDLDPQASLTIGFLKVNALSQLDPTVYSVLTDDNSIEEAVFEARENIDIIPANINLAGAELSLLNEYDRGKILKTALDTIKANYDFVLLDCPPSLSILTVNGLAAADGVVIPMACEYYSLVGVSLLLDTINKLKKRLNPQLKIYGVLPTRLDRRTNHSIEVDQIARSKLSKQVNVFGTSIRNATIFQKAVASAQTITEYDQNHGGAADYVAFAKELINA